MNWRVNSMLRLPSISRMALKLALVACAISLGCFSAEAKPKKPKKKSAPVAAETPANEDKSFEIPIPIGHDAKGIRIPIYSPEGVLQMIFESEVAFRVDAQQLRLTQLKIETYEENGQRDMSIDMPSSVFDLRSRVLSSVDPVTVRRKDLEMIGGNMTFDTQTRQGKFTGPVRMLIFDVNNEVKKPLEKSEPHE